MFSENITTYYIAGMSSWEKAYVLGRILPKTAVIPLLVGLLPLIMLIKMPMFNVQVCP